MRCKELGGKADLTPSSGQSASSIRATRSLSRAATWYRVPRWGGALSPPGARPRFGPPSLLCTLHMSGEADAEKDAPVRFFHSGRPLDFQFIGVERLVFPGLSLIRVDAGGPDVQAVDSGCLHHHRYVRVGLVVNVDMKSANLPPRMTAPTSGPDAAVLGRAVRVIRGRTRASQMQLAEVIGFSRAESATARCAQSELEQRCPVGGWTWVSVWELATPTPTA
jgi:hypothetical protein